MQRCYYAPTFLDESLSFPDRRGNQQKTGKLSGMVFVRRFFIRSVVPSKESPCSRRLLRLYMKA